MRGFVLSVLQEILIIGAAMGYHGHGNHVEPPPKWNILFPKNYVISVDSIFWIFIKNFHNFVKNFPIIWIFRLNARKLHAEVLKVFEKQAEIMHFSIFLRSFCKFSKILRLPGRRPTDSYGADPLKCSPNRNHGCGTSNVLIILKIHNVVTAYGWHVVTSVQCCIIKSNNNCKQFIFEQLL